eukprot:CCRYP_020207-RA/>CCRYP_020207-RA protein AED:0.07 eAED:0.07 QI:1156/1/1/1/0.5/0.33/9/384/436
MERESRNAIALTISPNDKFKCNYDNGELIDKWTSSFLAEFERPKATPKSKSPKPRIVFGRTTHPQNHEETRPRTGAYPPGSCPKPRFSLFAGTKLSHNRAMETLKQRETIMAPKFKGPQIYNFKIDLSKAREKRKRQLQYSREVASGAKSQKQREIDSITRIVVQGFRKLIDCERCALFLMDEATNDLYFKPVGDSDHSHARLKAIRFPASSGVAGWVASNKMMCNIKNAYHDIRFNPEIDKVTGFRTRTILCYPVLSSSNDLLGVIQMVNKKKGDAKELRDSAKKKKSDDQNKGYQSSYEAFSERDEEILGKCCAEVSKSLEEIFHLGDKPSNSEDGMNQMPDDTTFLMNTNIPNSNVLQGAGRDTSHEDDTSLDQTEESSKSSQLLKRGTRSRRRRSSSGSLAQFVRRSSSERPSVISTELGVNEAMQKFQFRS